MARLTLNISLLIIFLAPLFHINQVFTNPNKSKEAWAIRTKKKAPITPIAPDSNPVSISDYVTPKNIAIAGAVVTVGAATCGAGLCATAQCLGVAGAPSVGVGLLAGGVIGASVSCTTGATALAIKRALS